MPAACVYTLDCAVTAGKERSGRKRGEEGREGREGREGAEERGAGGGLERRGGEG